MRRKSVYEGLLKYTRNLRKVRIPNRIYDTITKNICALLKADASILFIYGEGAKKLKVVSSYNISRSYRNLAEEDVKIANLSCERKRVKVVKDVKQIYRKSGKTVIQLLKAQQIASVVSIPMVVDGKSIGAINVYYSSPIQTFADRETAHIFAEIAGQTIAHARATDELIDKKRTMKGINDIGKVTSSSFSIDELVQNLLLAAANLAKAVSVKLLLLDDEHRIIVDAYEYKKGSTKIQRCIPAEKLDEGLPFEVLNTRKVATISNRGRLPHVKKKQKSKGPLSAAGIPLMARGKIVGILILESHTRASFSKSEIDNLKLLANQSAIAIDNVALNKKVKREAKETALLYDVSQSLISTLDFEQLLRNILQRLKDTFNFLNVSVLLIDEEKQVLYTHASLVYSPEDRELRLRIGKDGITGHVAKTKRMYHCQDVTKDPYYVTGIENTRSEVCFPLLIGDRLIGVLDVESSVEDGFSQDVILLLSSLSAQIAIAIDNARLYAETKKLSLTDPLTSLSNRRSYQLFVDAEIRRAERYRRTFVVMMIDFDNFKNYNDRYGHTAGDIVLQKLSKIMKDIIRDVDFLCRYGGDEFVAILPETDASFALDVAERMRKKIAAQRIQPKITLSIGIASFPHDAREKSKLIDLADQACYEAKQRGGNRVIFTFKPKEER
ncbi:MAG: diguanylate cyclase [candidate division WOR-3 bacterium]|nr:MAG: diguanylate cyclase [candidate division WOR-3 bacterium]